MIIRNRFLRGLFSTCWYSFAALVVLLALVLTLARTLLPHADTYHDEIQQLISERAEQPVKIGTVTAQWRGITPYLVVTNIDLLDTEGKTSLLHFGSAAIGLDLWQSLLQKQVVFSSLTMRELRLYVTRYKDGHIDVHGLSPRDEPAVANGSGQLAGWLFGQPDIGIEDSELVWTDKASGHDQVRFSNVSLRMRNIRQRHLLEGRVGLPEEFGRSVKLALDIEGDMQQPREWVGSLFVNGNDIRPQNWLGPLQVGGLRVEGGEFDIELWSEWQKSYLERFEGSIDARELKLVLNGLRSPLRKVSAKVDWRRQQQGWLMNLDNVHINAGAEWPETRMLVNRRAGIDYDIQLGFIRLQDVIPVLQASGAFAGNSAALQVLQPRGDISDIHLRYIDQQQGRVLASAAASFSDFGIEPWPDIGLPGVDNLSGHISGTTEQGRLEIDARHASINYPDIFRNVLLFDALQGKFSWQRSAGDLQIHADDLLLANEDLRSKGYFSLELPAAGQSPFLDLVMEYEGMRGDHASRYYPAWLMDPDALSWLDTSIQQGRVPAGGVVVRGPLNAFPFKHHEGRFEATLRVEDGVLEYVPGWPKITGIGADIVFDGEQMRIHADKGRIFSSRIESADVGIADLTADTTMLDVRGQTYGSTQDALQYVLATELAGAHSAGLKRLQVDGHTRVVLDTKIPITGETQGYSRGHFTLEQSAVALKGSQYRIDAIDGEVSFDGDVYKADGIKARLFGEPISIDVDSHLPAGPYMPAAALEIRSGAQLALNNYLNKQFKLGLPAIIDGTDNWRFGLRIPEKVDDPVLFTLASELAKSTVTLPEPLAKASGEKRELRILASLKPDLPDEIRLFYAGVLNAIFVEDDKQPATPLRGQVQFGEVPARLPEKPGIAIAGNIPRLPLDSWLVWQAQQARGKDSARDPAWLQDVNVSIGELLMSGRQFNNVRLDARRDQSAWRIAAESDQLAGMINFPFKTGSLPIILDLQYLKIPGEDTPLTGERFDPRSLPAMDIRIGQFVYDGTDYGRLAMKLVPQLEGSFIDNLQLESKHLLITASGDWQVVEQGKSQLTRIKATASSDDTGKAMRQLGFSAGIKGGEGSAEAQLTWLGGPMDFSPAYANGTLSLDIRRGQLSDVEPGAGRVFGLLSLATLPRRLILDFSDLFSKGFSFDQIHGDFSLDNGSAYTTNLYLEGPPARIDVSGRVGLRDEDYDQLVTVTPRLTSSLPLAGALVGGPVAGGVLFAVDKLFGKSIDSISSYQYTITGSWDEPQVTPLKDKQAKPEEKRE